MAQLNEKREPGEDIQSRETPVNGDPFAEDAPAAPVMASEMAPTVEDIGDPFAEDAPAAPVMASETAPMVEDIGDPFAEDAPAAPVMAPKTAPTAEDIGDPFAEDAPAAPVMAFETAPTVEDIGDPFAENAPAAPAMASKAAPTVEDIGDPFAEDAPAAPVMAAKTAPTVEDIGDPFAEDAPAAPAMAPKMAPTVEDIGDPFAEDAPAAPVMAPKTAPTVEDIGDPFAEDAPAAPAMAPKTAPTVEDIGDPFAEDIPAADPFDYEPKQKAKAAPPPPPRSGWETFRDKFLDFAHTRRGKIILTVSGCLLVLILALIIFLRSWIKPPPLPVEPDGDKRPDQSQGRDDGKDGPGLTDPDDPNGDDYTDDGFNGDVPTVSGDRKDGVYTFLLVGTDGGGGNTDTIMVVNYDTKKPAVSVMSIPRDTMINVSWDIKKINSVYSRYGTPERGMEQLMTQVSRLIGFKPDYYIKVDLEMFVKLVDLVGGVEFYVPQDMKYKDPYQDLYIDLNEGLQLLDGDKAMQLVRFRHYEAGQGDIDRVQVQQDFMKALIKKCLSIGNWGKIKNYIDLGMAYVEMSAELDYGNIVWFAAQALGIGGASTLDMDDVYTCTLPGDYFAETWSRATNQNQSYVTIYPNQVVSIVNERFNPYVQDVTAAMLDAMSILSNGDIASSIGNLRDTQHNAIMAVRRGEAYYDDNGNIVYGQKPTKPKVFRDEDGNYYIMDEDGEIIYTDENGTPLDAGEDPEGGETGDPGKEEDPDQPDDPGGTEDPDPETPSGDGGGEQDEPEDPEEGDLDGLDGLLGFLT